MHLRSKQTPSGVSETATVASTPNPKTQELLSLPRTLFILPQCVSKDAFFITAPDPATKAPNRYLVCPETGFFEMTCIAGPKDQFRSWLIANGSDSGENIIEARIEDSSFQDLSPYTIQMPLYFVATPLDPLYLVLPLLSTVGHATEFLAISDYVARLDEQSPELARILALPEFESLRRKLEQRMQLACSTMDIGYGCVYALSPPQVMQALIAKARKLIGAQRWPASVDCHFVKDALKEPQLQRESGSCVSKDTEDNFHEITSLLRVRTCVEFIINLYIPADLRPTLVHLLEHVDPGIVDFAPLRRHTARLDALRNEARALQSLSDNISRKRSFAGNDEDSLAMKEAKKPKQESEEEKRKSMPIGMKQLSKANITGMKKLSTFFVKTSTPQAKKQ